MSLDALLALLAAAGFAQPAKRAVPMVVTAAECEVGASECAALIHRFLVKTPA